MAAGLAIRLAATPVAPVLSPRQLLQQQLSAPLPERPELVLVTDLDGTLLGGATPERRRF